MFDCFARCFRPRTRKHPSPSEVSAASSRKKLSVAVADDWNCPPDFFVDRLVEFLKRTHRWSVDGRSLRRLNRTWCLHLNQHVTTVRPHESRGALYSSAASLLKFSRLTTLDLSSFVLDANEHLVEENLRVIHRLPRLSRVEVSRKVLRKLKGRDLRRLSGYHCVVSSSEPCNQYDVTRLKKLSAREVDFKGNDEDLHRIVKELRHLKHLRAFIELSRRGGYHYMQALNYLESLKLVVQPGGFSVSFPEEIKSLVSLKLIHCGEIDPESLTRLPFLRRLEMPIDSETLNSEAFLKLQQMLTTLRLWPVNAEEKIELTGTARKPANLQFLSLTRFRLKNLGISDNFSQLTGLCLTEFASDVGMSFLKLLRCLKKLCLIDVHSNDWNPNQVALNQSVLPSLTELTIEIQTDGQTWIQNICTLSKLEVLGLCMETCSYCHQALFEMEKLPNLHTLKIDCIDPCASLKPRLHCELWSRLECLHTNKKKKNSETLQSIFRTIAPHLKVELHSPLLEKGWLVNSFHSTDTESGE